MKGVGVGLLCLISTLVAVLFVLGSYTDSRAQQVQQTPASLPSVAPPSPEAASLGKYGDIPVSYHTGVPNISIPLYELKEGDVRLPISISYHASGIRVSEVASWVGLGWALNAGGVITRSVQHGLDEGPMPNTAFDPPTPLVSYFDDAPKYHTGYYRDGFTLAPRYDAVNAFDPLIDDSNIPHSTYNKMADQAQGNSDTEPDIFFFNVGGYSGKFLFKVDVDDSTNVVVSRTALFIPKSDVKVEVQFGNLLMPHYPSGTELSETFIGFTLTTPDGFKYYFGGDSTSIEFTGSQVFNASNYESSTAVSLAPSSWYLKKIESPTGKHIDLQYTRDKYGYYDVAPEQIQTGMDDYTNLNDQMISRNVVNGLKLLKITSSTEEVLFAAEIIRNDLSTYNNNGGGEQTDGRMSKSLDRIEVNLVDHTPVKKFIFDFDYFEGTDGTFPHFLNNSQKSVFTTDLVRLKLNSITEASGDGSVTLPPHRFTYIEDQPLPRRISFQQDHWGYYNHETGNTGLISFWQTPRKNHRGTNAQYTQLGTLKSIKYPTGGMTTFAYESNEGPTTFENVDDPDLGRNYVADSQTVSGNGAIDTVRFATQSPQEIYSVSPCIALGMGCFDFQITVKLRAGSPTGGIYDIDYRNDADIRVSHAIEIRRSSDDSIVTWFEFSGLDDCESGSSTCSNTGGGAPGQYFREITRTYVVSLPAPTNFHYGEYYARAFRLEGTHNGTPYLFTASFDINIDRAEDPYFTPAVNQGLTKVGGLRIKSIVTSDGTGPDQQRLFTYPSTGGRVFSQPQYFYKIHFLFNSDLGDNVHASVGAVAHMLWSSNSIFPMRTTQGNHIGYEWVKEEQVGNGYKVYSYNIASNSVNFSDDPFFQGNSYSYQAPHRQYDYPPYPAPLDIEMGNLLGEEVYNNAGKIVMSTYHSYESATDIVLLRATKVAFIHVKVSDPTLPSPNSTQVNQIAYTHYPIFTTTNRKKTETVSTNYDSNGNNPSTVITTYDYNGLGHLQATRITRTMDDVEYVDNIIYPPDYGSLSSTTGGIKNLKDRSVINVPVEKYTVKRATGQTTGKVISGTLTQFKTDTTLPDAVYSLKLSQPLAEASFTPSNNFHDSFNPSSSYEKRLSYHSYDGLGNIIEVSKNNDTHVAYIWGYSGSRPIAEVKNATKDQVFHTSFEELTTNVSSESKTGDKSYTAAYTVVPPASGTFKLTYWQKVGTGAWTPVETTISSNTNIGGTGTLIDEVRVYPSTAQMTTYTYDITAGMTTMTDVNNLVTRYHYDALKRLQYVTDHNGKVLKTYTYHYKNQTGN
jgi:hypothetical protein